MQRRVTSRRRCCPDAPLPDAAPPEPPALARSIRHAVTPALAAASAHRSAGVE
ncbi:hypothetical protein [Sorangium sp. So ce1153]|uniref:hypothetical protein n=1 Tax=Sorangium sp. So ce1153 TaxID=3133333 RepID=UPI003F60120C